MNRKNTSYEIELSMQKTLIAEYMKTITTLMSAHTVVTLCTVAETTLKQNTHVIFATVTVWKISMTLWNTKEVRL